VREPPIVQVFRFYCVEGLPRCGCVESLITLRLQQIEQKLGRPPAELRALSSQFHGAAQVRLVYIRVRPVMWQLERTLRRVGIRVDLAHKPQLAWLLIPEMGSIPSTVVIKESLD
jgi:hypothetical protein